MQELIQNLISVISERLAAHQEIFVNPTTKEDLILLLVKPTDKKERCKLLLQMAKNNSKDKTFKRQDLFAEVEKYGFSNFGYKGKTPHQSLSREITESMVKELQLFAFVDKGSGVY